MNPDDTLAALLKNNTTAIILAGGAGRRVNGLDKGLIKWHGQPLVEHVYARIAPQVSSVVISCNRNTDYYRTISPIVTDLRKGLEGPLAGIEAAAPAVSTDYALIVACDTPNLPTNLVSLLLPHLVEAQSNYDIAYAHDGDRAQFLCAAIRTRRLCGAGSALDKNISAVKAWYATERSTAVRVDVPRTAFANHNSLSGPLGEP
ncbi:MAG: molybdenum cofactor guanylyltransferase MobA [Halioglobus sp.]